MKKEKKKYIIGSIIGLLLLGGITNNSNSQENKTNKNTPNKEKPIILKTCDGINVIENCEIDGIKYSTYKFHPAEEEKYHYETKTVYETGITGYCTLCNDGTYSPTCATGRGACSHHSGVAQFNAPIYGNIPKKTQEKIIDSPAKEEYWEIVEK